MRLSWNEVRARAAVQNPSTAGTSGRSFKYDAIMRLVVLLFLRIATPVLMFLLWLCGGFRNARPVNFLLIATAVLIVSFLVSSLFGP